jgi:hypothetical protein
MGNRAYVVFENGDNRSPAVYLHWNGGQESVYAFLHALEEYGGLGHSPEYSCARFIQLVGNSMGSTLSLGVLGFREFGQLAGEDNGLYMVTPNGVRRLIGEPGGTPEQQRWVDTWSLDLRWLRPEEVEAERQAALSHPYWHPKPGETSILEAIHQANDALFRQHATA